MESIVSEVSLFLIAIQMVSEAVSFKGMSINGFPFFP